MSGQGGQRGKCFERCLSQAEVEFRKGMGSRMVPELLCVSALSSVKNEQYLHHRVLSSSNEIMNAEYLQNSWHMVWT